MHRIRICTSSAPRDQLANNGRPRSIIRLARSGVKLSFSVRLKLTPRARHARISCKKLREVVRYIPTSRGGGGHLCAARYAGVRVVTRPRAACCAHTRAYVRTCAHVCASTARRIPPCATPAHVLGFAGQSGLSIKPLHPLRITPWTRACARACAHWRVRSVLACCVSTHCGSLLSCVRAYELEK